MTLIQLLVVAALLLLVLGLLLLIGVAVLWIGLQRGTLETYEPELSIAPDGPALGPAFEVAPTAPASIPAAPPPPLAPSRGLDSGLGMAPAASLPDAFGSENDEEGKTEVFARGRHEWGDDEEDEEGATEIFRSEDFSLD